VGTFTQELILRSFEVTGISLLQPNVILHRFAKNTTKASDSSASSSSVYSGKNWLKIETLLQKVVSDETSKKLKKLSRSLHHISVQNLLLHHENQSLKEALKTQKKHKKKSKTLDLQSDPKYHGGAVFWSPCKVQEACLCGQVRQEEEQAENLKKAEMTELRRANKLYNEKIAQEKREQQVREKEEREQLRAGKAKEAAERKAQRERDKQACDAEKAIQLPQRGKRKASTAPLARISKKRCVRAAFSRTVVASPPPCEAQRIGIGDIRKVLN
jgi:hypothetical protein